MDSVFNPLVLIINQYETTEIFILYSAAAGGIQ